jgi:hypothetical protein
MAENRDRSMNAELIDGMCDGTYKRVIRDRSLYPDPDRRLQRADRIDLFHGTGGYGVAEKPEKRTPDGRYSHSQGFVPPLFPEVTVRTTEASQARQVIKSEVI